MPFFARVDLTSRQLLQWSTVPFTVKVTSTEADHVFPDDVKIPGPITELRVSADGTTLIHDPALEPPPPMDRKVLHDRALAATKFEELQAVVVKLLQ